YICCLNSSFNACVLLCLLLKLFFSSRTSPILFPKFPTSLFIFSFSLFCLVTDFTFPIRCFFISLFFLSDSSNFLSYFSIYWFFSFSIVFISLRISVIYFPFSFCISSISLYCLIPSFNSSFSFIISCSLSLLYCSPLSFLWYLFSKIFNSSCNFSFLDSNFFILALYCFSFFLFLFSFLFRSLTTFLNSIFNSLFSFFKSFFFFFFLFFLIFGLWYLFSILFNSSCYFSFLDSNFFILALYCFSFFLYLFSFLFRSLTTFLNSIFNSLFSFFKSFFNFSSLLLLT